mmetsp:Transcript_26664/g.46419  ORF Transcript_26664/g.46419 Transcript_26664/m.46419 type:complete len:212 (+) Transcript_26664:589-1224(+)
MSCCWSKCPLSINTSINSLQRWNLHQYLCVWSLPTLLWVLLISNFLWRQCHWLKLCCVYWHLCGLCACQLARIQCGHGCLWQCLLLLGGWRVRGSCRWRGQLRCGWNPPARISDPRGSRWHQIPCHLRCFRSRFQRIVRDPTFSRRGRSFPAFFRPLVCCRAQSCAWGSSEGGRILQRGGCLSPWRAKRRVDSRGCGCVRCRRLQDHGRVC